MPPSIPVALVDGLLAVAAILPPGVGALALVAGGLVCLAGDEDLGRRAAARHGLALGLGGLASLGLAAGLAGLLASLLAGP